MTTNIVVPSLGESVSEAIIAKWYKKVGESVKADEPICELETDKVTMEVNAPTSGAIEAIDFAAGSTVAVGAVIGKIKEGAAGVSVAAAPAKEAPKAEAPKVEAPKPAENKAAAAELSPAVRKMVAENNIDAAKVSGSGKDGRLTKGDVLGAIKGGLAALAANDSPAMHAILPSKSDRQERVKMTRLRQAIARRLKASQNTAAILTTFNEIDMTNVIALREKYKDSFEKKFNIKLGFMGFFLKAAVHALKEVPAVNAFIDGDDIVFNHFCDVGVAVGTPQGLVVPVVRDADQKSLAEIELEIANLAIKARDGKLSMEEMSGGTFTVSNGGVYGSLMSTPIINPPQSGILGMHKTEKRPVVVDDQIVIRQMMYVALSYDHRIIDGRESVTFLVKVKEAIEDPARLVLGV